MSTIYTNGIGGTLGDTLTTCKPLYAKGNVWYVDYASGADGTSPAGRERGRPLKTLAYALANAGQGDIVVLLATHDETVTSALSISDNGLTLVGESSSASGPTATLRNGVTSANMLETSTANVSIRGVKFAAPTSATSYGTLVIQNPGCTIVDCVFEVNGNNNASAVQLLSGATDVEFRDCTFTSTATSATDLPYPALKSTITTASMRMDDCVFDGGDYGFADASSQNYAMDISSTTWASLRVNRVELTNGADISAFSTFVGSISVSSSDGSARVYFREPS